MSEPATVLAAFGLVAATIYALWIVQRVFQGRETPAVTMPDLTLREGGMLAAMAAPLLWLGVYPQPVFNAVRPSLAALQRQAVRAPCRLPPCAWRYRPRRRGGPSARPARRSAQRRGRPAPARHAPDRRRAGRHAAAAAGGPQ